MTPRAKFPSTYLSRRHWISAADSILQCAARNRKYSYSTRLEITLSISAAKGAGQVNTRMITHIIPLGDSIYVLDMRNITATLLGTERNPIRTLRLPGRPIRALVLDADHFIVNSIIPTRDLIGYPLHQLSSTGEVVRSFGAQEEFSMTASLNGIRALTANGAHNGFWTAETVDYTLREYSAEGVLIQTIVRDAPWFPLLVMKAEPPQAALKDISIDSRGFIWVPITKRAANWRQALDAARSNPRLVGVNNDLWDSVIEVLDPYKHTLVARFTSDEDLIRFTGDRSFVSYREGRDGVPMIILWQAALTGA